MITIFLLILLIISITNNYFTYKFSKYKNSNKFYLNNVPSNLRYMTISFFYKDKEFDMCHKNDNEKSDIKIRNYNEMNIFNVLEKLNKDNIYYIVNRNNKNYLYLNDIINDKLKKIK